MGIIMGLSMPVIVIMIVFIMGAAAAGAAWAVTGVDELLESFKELILPAEDTPEVDLGEVTIPAFDSTNVGLDTPDAQGTEFSHGIQELPADTGIGLDSSNGITGENFYGARVVYRDPDNARGEILRTYVRIVNKIVYDLRCDATLVVNIECPTGAYSLDWSTVGDSSYQAQYSEHYAMVRAIADIVHGMDKADESVVIDSTDTAYLIKVVNNIGHFGFHTEMIAPISDSIKAYLKSNNLITLADSESGVDISATIDTVVDTHMATVSAVQTEKYFVRDYSLSDTNEMLKDIPLKNYVAVIFMNRGSVTFTSFSFQIVSANDNITAKVTNDGIDVTEFSKNKDGKENGVNVYTYSADVDTTASQEYMQYHLNCSLSDRGTNLYSLFCWLDAVEDGYEDKVLRAQDDGTYTYLDNVGVQVVFGSTGAFTFAEIDTLGSFNPG